jgi:iron complex outermembrane receptor protein
MNASAQQLEEIIVTAQKREQNIQDIGIAITAFSGDQIRELGWLDSTQVVDQVPNVQLVQPNSRNSYGFSVRGVLQVDFADHQEHPTAVYVDEVYISQASAAGFQLFDLERVEVLRGPQGTLWGRNATGGGMAFTTTKPTQEFEGYIDALYGSENNVGLEFAIGGGITDKMSARVSGKFNEHDGYAKNLVGEDQFDDDTTSFRGQVLYEFNDRVSLLVNARTASSDLIDGAAHTQPASYDEANGFGFERGPNDVSTNLGVENAVYCPGCDFFGWAEPNGDDRTLSHDFIGFSELDTKGFGARLDWETDNFDFVSITDWSTVEKEYMEDSDNTPFPVLETFLGNDVDQFSQEIRFSGESEGFRWTAGAYYLRIRGDYGTGVTLRSDVEPIGAEPSAQTVGSISPADSLVDPDNPDIFCFGGGGFEDLQQTCGLQPTSHPEGILLASAFFEQKTDSLSVFAQTEFDLTPTLTLTTGLRLIQEDKEFDYDYVLDIWTDGVMNNDTNQVLQRRFLAPSDPALVLVDFDKNSAGDLAEYDELLWSGKIALDWHVNEDLLTYFSINRGVKGGGFNGSAVGDTLRPEQVPFDEEVLYSYEVGFKATLADNRVRLNGAAFFYDYQDFQAFIFQGQANFISNQDAEIYGAELEIEASPIAGLDIKAGVAYLQGEVFDVTFPFTDLDTGVEFTQPLDVDLPRAPEWSVNAMARYEFPTAFAGTSLAGNFAISGDFNWRDDQNMLLSEASIGEQEAYAIFNASASFTSEDNKWQATLRVENLTDEFYCSQIFDVGADFNSRQCFFNKPRWYSASVRFNF